MRLFLTRNTDGRLQLWNGRPMWSEPTGRWTGPDLEFFDIDEAYIPDESTLDKTKMRAVEVFVIEKPKYPVTLHLTL